MTSICYYVVCASYCGVCFMLVWEYIYISFACLANNYGTITSFTAQTCV
jgi:hypothetical protein